MLITLCKFAGTKIHHFLCKFWIVLFYILLLVMAIQEPYIYRLIYMILLLYSAITFHVSRIATKESLTHRHRSYTLSILLQFSYRFWRVTLKFFLIVVALYSILAVILIYVFSFHLVLLTFQLETKLQNKW